jgi:transcriptional regulator with XRE-family HTH domain
MGTTLAEKVDRLFRTKASPRGKEFTYREVASGISQQDSVTFSPAYVWQLRTGVKDNPTMRHLQALARFFEVSPAYFFDEELTQFADGHARVLAAARSETLQRIATTLLGLSDESLGAVLNLASRLRHLERVPRDEEVPQAVV